MNRDQALSITRTLLKVIGSALVTHGATKAAGLLNSEDVIGLILTVVGLLWSHFDHSEETATKPNPIIGTLPMVLFFAALAAVACASTTGCASSRVHTLETRLDGTQVETEVRAHTFFDSKSELAKPKALVTDKTASSAVGSMNQESSGSNAVQVLKIVVEGAVSAAK